MIEIVLFLAGILCGTGVLTVFRVLSRKRKAVGKLRMDDSTGDSYLFMELKVPVEYVLMQKEITLEVDLTPITRD